MLRRQLPPGEVSQKLQPDPGQRGRSSVEPALGPWDGYLRRADGARIGICCSGGGIRSGSFSLGGLQVLREKGLLSRADYLSCVSGGGYITIAHALMTSETIRRASDDIPPGEVESTYFGAQAPWAPGSPEEEHLRDRLTYLAPGFLGKAWAALNLLYGALRLVLPFAAGLYIAGFVMGLFLHPWLGHTLTTGEPCADLRCVTFSDLLPFAFVSLGFLALSAVFMSIRNLGQKRNWSEWSMLRYQLLTFSAIAITLTSFFLLVALPQVLIGLHRFGERLQPSRIAAGYSALSLLVAIVTFITKHYRSKWFQLAIKAFITLSAPIIILVPFVGFTYWNAQWGTESNAWFWRVLLGVLSVGTVGLFVLLANEVTSIAHLFYRERLATAFVGYRRHHPRTSRLSYAQPPWSDPLHMSTLRRGSFENSKMPKLVVCCAVNLSDGVPIGRNADSFTFDQDLLVGGPTTGYKRIEWLEQQVPDVATLPTMMAASGAAVSPSMGKMTRPAVRFVMALFNLRLGIWAPNPFRHDPWWPWMGEIPDPPQADEPGGLRAAVAAHVKRPGAGYILREAIGANSLDSRHVYVTDGGHWENLGLVELLRRGCMRVVCIDGSGGDAVSFGTLSEAIALARSDLGIEIDIDLEDLKPCADLGACADGDDKQPGGLGKLEKRLSKAGFAEGTIRFPNVTELGKLLYVRAVIPRSAPQDVLSYALKDKRFPNTSTANQLFTDVMFEAYRALGRYSVQQALECRPIDDPPKPRDRDCP